MFGHVALRSTFSAATRPREKGHSNAYNAFIFFIILRAITTRPVNDIATRTILNNQVRFRATITWLVASCTLLAIELFNLFGYKFYVGTTLMLGKIVDDTV